MRHALKRIVGMHPAHRRVWHPPEWTTGMVFLIDSDLTNREILRRWPYEPVPEIRWLQ